MKNTLKTFAILSIVTLVAFKISNNWKVEESKYNVTWMLADSSHEGSFTGLKSNIDFNKENLSTSTINASIDVKTIKAGNPKLEAHLLNADFFDADKYPTIEFNSKNIIQEGNAYIANGTLKMKDSTKVIAIPFSFENESENLGIFKGTITIFASEFGVTKKPKTPGGDKVIINLSIPVSKQ